jgi:hypothetical protein
MWEIFLHNHTEHYYGYSKNQTQNWVLILFMCEIRIKIETWTRIEIFEILFIFINKLEPRADWRFTKS